MLTFLGEPKDHHVHEHAHESPPSMTVPLVLLAVLAVVGGFVVFEGVGQGARLPQRLARLRLQPGRGARGVPHRLVRCRSPRSCCVGCGLGAGWCFWGGEAKPAKRAGDVLAVRLPAAAQPLLHRRDVPADHRHVVLAAGQRHRLVRPRSRERHRRQRHRRGRRALPGCSRSTSRPASCRTTRSASSSAWS